MCWSQIYGMDGTCCLRMSWMPQCWSDLPYSVYWFKQHPSISRTRPGTDWSRTSPLQENDHRMVIIFPASRLALTTLGIDPRPLDRLVYQEWWLSFNGHTQYIYIYIYVCVCVCVCTYIHTYTHTHCVTYSHQTYLTRWHYQSVFVILSYLCFVCVCGGMVCVSIFLSVCLHWCPGGRVFFWKWRKRKNLYVCGSCTQVDMCVCASVRVCVP